MSMIDFVSHVTEEWELSQKIAQRICEHFDAGDSVYYVDDYDPVVSAEVEFSTLAEVYGELNRIHDLDSKKKRVSNALKKADALDEDAEHAIRYSVSSEELDDMILAYRPNVRSKGQIAIKKGLEPLADLIDEQETEDGNLEDIAKEYVGKDKTLKTVEDVLKGVKDILAERYAHEDTGREMVRDIGFEDGFFEVIPKNKKDKAFAMYRGVLVPAPEMEPKEYLRLKQAELDKTAKFKHGVQLFQITELLRHHFIENPDAIGNDLLNETIDDCWSRLLQPMVEKSVKAKLDANAEKWALTQIDKDLDEIMSNRGFSGAMIAVGQFSEKKLTVAAINSDGRLLGITSEKLHGTGRAFTSNRIRQFHNRFRITRAVILENDHAELAEAIVEKTMTEVTGGIPMERYKSEKAEVLAASDWMKAESGEVLDDDMKLIYALGLLYVQPVSIMTKTGLSYFNIHDLQSVISEESLTGLLRRRLVIKELHSGIAASDAPDSVLINFTDVTEDVLMNIRKAANAGKISCKEDLKSVDGVTDSIYRNIAGYIVIPGASNPFDCTLVHPEYYGWVESVASDLGKNGTAVINDPESVRSADLSDAAEKIYADKKLIGQLKVADKYKKATGTVAVSTRKLRLNELEEDKVVTGKVTNITAFGVFVDINSVCDGLVHISELADGYIESAEQVVNLGQKVDVRIIGVDKKKRRVSLSMKNLGNKAPKVRPSKGQLSNLADHFKTR